MANLNNIGDVLKKKLEKAVSELPTILANEAVNFTKDRFTKQGWQEETLQPWQKRKSNAPRNKGRAILIDTGRLKRSIRIISTSALRAEFGSVGVPYAAAHNYGFHGTVTVKAHNRKRIGNIKVSSGKTGKTDTKKGVTGTSQVRSFQRRMNLPQRKFLGNSIFLHRQLQRIAALHIARTINS